jgi:hypothetical protein
MVMAMSGVSFAVFPVIVFVGSLGHQVGSPI